MESPTKIVNQTCMCVCVCVCIYVTNYFFMGTQAGGCDSVSSGRYFVNITFQLL